MVKGIGGKKLNVCYVHILKIVATSSFMNEMQPFKDCLAFSIVDFFEFFFLSG